MRILLSGAALLLTSGCAIFAPADRRAGTAPETERTVIYSDGELEPASLGAPRVADGAPIGLTPCKRKSFPAQDCWRRGDQHILFPPSAVTAGMPSVSDSIAVAEKR